MSIETRSNSALFKRAEQLRRWEESDTNREPVTVNGRPKKIKFSAGCVFLAACKAGDRDEILRLLKKGADIDTHDVDGLSALHQACIDDNLELVEFLVENGADVNKGDNEGWTPLHATASCGFLSIAGYLIEKGANVAAVNNDGELPVDVAESDEMEDMLQQKLEDLGIDAENARTEEERLMLADAKNWLSSGYFGEKAHPRTGATALHVASAKGYLKVIDTLIKAGADVDAQDFDGWTPIHAAAHWGQKEAAEVLAEAHCDMGIRNFVGQTPIDVAENEMVRVLEDLRKKQATLPKDNIERRKNINKIPVNQKPVISDGLECKSDKSSDKEDESENSLSEKVPPVQKVELQIHSPSKPSESVTISNPHENQSNVEKKNHVNKDELSRLPTMAEANKTVPNTQVQNTPSKQNELEDTPPSWRRPGSFRSRLQEAVRPGLSLRIGEKESPTTPTTTVTNSRQQNAIRNETPQEVVLRRTQSFEADEKFYRRYLELRAKINAGNSCPALHATPMRSASLKERRVQAREESRVGSTVLPSAGVSSSAVPASQPVSSAATPPVTTASPTSNSPQTTTQVRRSFVPPVRDEESETQRKAHAKRVRETRRSTQGVTLEEIKSAEQLVKKKQQQVLQQASQQLNNSEFMLEDARKSDNTSSSTSAASNDVVRRTAVATPVTETGDTTVTLPLRKVRSDDKDEKDMESRNAQATQAAIQRRRRPKRRSTGVVHVDMDEIDPDRHSDTSSGTSPSGEGDATANSLPSGGEGTEPPSRLTSEPSSVPDNNSSRTEKKRTENGEIDYKKLYEESLVENDRLRSKLRQTEDELAQVKETSEKNALLATRSSLSETEKREKRAMERKLSEMEEELKQLQKLKSDNERLRAENRALTRVVSKLTSSHIK